MSRPCPGVGTVLLRVRPNSQLMIRICQVTYVDAMSGQWRAKCAKLTTHRIQKVITINLCFV